MRLRVPFSTKHLAGGGGREWRGWRAGGWVCRRLRGGSGICLQIFMVLFLFPGMKIRNEDEWAGAGGGRRRATGRHTSPV